MASFIHQRRFFYTHTHCQQTSIAPEPTPACRPFWHSDQPFCQLIRENTKKDAFLDCLPFPAGVETSDYQQKGGMDVCHSLSQTPYYQQIFRLVSASVQNSCLQVGNLLHFRLEHSEVQRYTPRFVSSSTAEQYTKKQFRRSKTHRGQFLLAELV